MYNKYGIKLLIILYLFFKDIYCENKNIENLVFITDDLNKSTTFYILSIE